MHWTSINPDPSAFKPSIEVQIPSVHPYVPPSLASGKFYSRLLFDPPRPPRSRNGSVISRFTTDDGQIGFTVEVTLGPLEETGDRAKIDVTLEDIYDYVTPEELERFENHDWELEDERERNRPKLGRPRKNSPADLSTIVMSYKSIRPRGRPRKRPLSSEDPLNISEKRQRKSSKDTRTAFAGVYVPSPVKSGQPTPNVSSYASPSKLRPLGMTSPWRESTLSSLEEVPTSGTRANQVDQLTPSNTNRVVGAKIPEPSPSQSAHKSSYSMVQAALGESDSSDEGDEIPGSPSEDELTLIPINQPRRFSARAEIASSTPSEDEKHQSLFLTPHGSSNNKSYHDNYIDTEMLVDDHRSLSDDTSSTSSQDADKLLQQFQASNSRRPNSKPSSSSSSEASRPKSIEQYFSPKRSLQRISASSKIPTSATTKVIPAPTQAADKALRRLPRPSGASSVVTVPKVSTFSSSAYTKPKPGLDRAPRELILKSGSPQLMTKYTSSVPPQPQEQLSKTLAYNQLPLQSPPVEPHSTPKATRQIRQSITPHFPSSRKQNSRPTSSHLRGGQSQPPMHSRSPSNIQSKHRVTFSTRVTPANEETHSRSNTSNKPSTSTGAITLGELETSSDDDGQYQNSNDHRPSTASRQDRSFKMGHNIILGSPITTSSSEDHNQIRREPEPVTNYPKKRRKSLSDDSNAGGGVGKTWYRMVRR